MPTARISAKGWVVIPAELRRKYRMEAGGEVSVVDYGGVISLVPALSDPVGEALGALKGPTSLTGALRDERRRERERESPRPVRA